MPARSRCRTTAVVTNNGSGTVSTIDVKTRTKHPVDIPVSGNPKGVALTPDGKTAFVTNANLGTAAGATGDSVSILDVKTRTKRTDITLGTQPLRVAVIRTARPPSSPTSRMALCPRLT